MFFPVDQTTDGGVWIDIKKDAAGHAGFCDWGSADVDCRFTNSIKYEHVWRTVVPRKRNFLQKAADVSGGLVNNR